MNGFGLPQERFLGMQQQMKWWKCCLIFCFLWSALLSALYLWEIRLGCGGTSMFAFWFVVGEILKGKALGEMLFRSFLKMYQEQVFVTKCSDAIFSLVEPLYSSTPCLWEQLWAFAFSPALLGLLFSLVVLELLYRNTRMLSFILSTLLFGVHPSIGNYFAMGSYWIQNCSWSG